MSVMQIVVVALCGVVIGLALLLLVKSIRKMIQGQCCEGCVGCVHARGCSSRDPDVDEQGQRRNSSALMKESGDENFGS